MKRKLIFKKGRFLLLSALLLVMAAMTSVIVACSGDENLNEQEVPKYVNWPKSDKKIPVELTDVAKLPNWLVEIAKQYPEEGEFLKTYIFAGKWNGQTIYLVYNPLMSSFYYHLYDSSGSRLEHGDNFEIIENSSGWKCIYFK